MVGGSSMAERDDGPLMAEKPDGAGPFVVICDHASNRIPERYGSLGLPADAIESHIAWDPGALAVSRELSARLDAPLLWSSVSRLVIDCNRDPTAPDLIITEGDGRPVPGNRGLDAAERAHRLETIHGPYHAGIAACLDGRQAEGVPTALVAIHSFTPVWGGERRPWQIGVVFDEDRGLADQVLAALQSDPAITVGINEPYSPADRVYYTMARHGSSRGLPAVMIEIRNDELGDPAGQKTWAARLADIFAAIAPRLADIGDAAA